MNDKERVKDEGSARVETREKGLMHFTDNLYDCLWTVRKEVLIFK